MPLVVAPGAARRDSPVPRRGSLWAALLGDGRALIVLSANEGLRLSVLDAERAMMHRLVELPGDHPSVYPTTFDTLTDGNALLLAAVADGPVGPMDALLAVGPDGSIVELAQVAQRGGRSITALPDGGALLYGRTLSMGEVDDDTDLLVSIPAP